MPEKGWHHTAESRVKISEALTGKPHPHRGWVHSQESRQKRRETLTGRPHPHRGYPASPESRQKNRDSHLGHPGLPGDLNPTKRPEVREKIRKAALGRSPNQATREKMSKARLGKPRPDIQGERNYRWRGGISKEPYPFTFDKLYKEKIRERDGRRCVLCGTLENGKRLHVHHIDFDKRNMNPLMKASLCASCHPWTTGHREASQKILTQIIKMRYT